MIKYVFVFVAYLLGSIPFSYLLGKWLKGEDLRKKGSGNLGATNAFRVFGKLIGLLVLILDMLKGGILIALMIYTDLFASLDLFHPLIYGLATVIGHVFPLWFNFKGGKGVASSFGLLLAYNPLMAAIILPVFVLTVFLTRYVSVASTVAALSALVYTVIFVLVDGIDWYFLIIALIAVSLIICKHKTNYLRIKAKTENRVSLFAGYDRWIARRKQAKNAK